MAEGPKGDNEPYDDINITPMVDLTFVLLIIFIIMTTAAIQGLKVDLPKASKAPSLAESKTKAITIDASGQIYLDTYAVTLEQLEAQLASMKAANPELPVVVKGDASVQYQQVISVLDLLGRLDITEVGLVTANIGKG